MATQLPTFPPFVVQNAAGESQNTAGIRWQKWIQKLENLLCALDITVDKRKKALLLHYCGEETYDIFDSFSDDDKGIGATKEVPNGEDNEILSQIIQGCTSSRIRRRALRDNYKLDKLIEEARALELSENRASEMESGPSSKQVNAIHQRGRGHRGRGRGRSNTYSEHTRGRGQSQHSRGHRGGVRPDTNQCGNCEQYPPLFDGKMGKIEGTKVKLHIDKEVPPVSQRHRRIPFHARKDVEAELKRLEDLDVIEPVSGPTPWVSPVVIVPKKSKGVRVCIDMREANKAISQEKHPMPTVEDLMADLNSSVVFSKLDLSNAYHQLELDEDSRYITTFSTHVGAKNLSDDIIIHGKSQAEHDRALKLTLDRLSSSGAKLNKEKCIFSVNKITFFGHVFSNVEISADPAKIKDIVGQAAPQSPGVSAILTQEGRVVCYASRALTDVEQRYSQTDREMLAVVYGVEHFHLYLFASEFKVITDHKPLVGIVHSQKPASALMERWRLRLMPYQFVLEYRPGKTNPADYMSRHPHDKPNRDNAAEAYVAYISQHAVPKAMTLEDVRRATQECTILQQVMITIQSGRWWGSPNLTPFVQFRDEYSIVDGVILRDHRLVIHASLQRRVVELAHHTHQGIVKTKQLIREKVWFPGIDKLVEDTVRACVPCQASYPGPSKREPVSPTALPSKPWSEVAVDFGGPFPSGQYLLVVIDEHSRFPEVEIVYSTSAKVVLPRLSAIFARHGYPDVVKSDNGPPFQGHEFADFAVTCGFKHRRITPLWPEANGTVERFMGTLNKFVRAAVADNRDWKTNLSSFLMHYRATPHSATQISPFEALTGRKMNVGLPEIPKLEPTSVPTRLSHNDAVSKAKMKVYADKRRHTTQSNLSQGDHVLVSQRKLDKLTPPYNPDPYTVIETRGSMVIAGPDGHTITRNSSHLKPVKAELSVRDEDLGPGAAQDPPDEFPEQPAPCPQALSPVRPMPTPISSPAPPRRNPSRSAGMPKRFNDFELG
ncbi:uncharacterized protein K02A2.6-like [Mya arenaria]|uniref:uncharacterized protein K02A2.6-like n=1 Tax=Mya arenaria TaxID=6604 RepID=UPI0022E6F3AF|nr:uncharacterized protein K02A2.6-like [Mya arenaria]